MLSIMRRLGIVLALGLGGASGCGGAVDAAPPADLAVISDGAAGAEERTEPIVGTLRMRDRDIPLTTSSLEARGNEQLHEMTARAVWADVDAVHALPVSHEGTLGAELPTALVDRF